MVYVLFFFHLLSVFTYEIFVVQKKIFNFEEVLFYRKKQETIYRNVFTNRKNFKHLKVKIAYELI